ncbi:unnamed protein product [Caenorhabditis auriculariae]|uniref:Uncharacterized protein n=1 Tax=Caenorhabditis auriculariae TaxID=2777116 RepID=A0A8S1HGC7_9PELO|nr:unnamed protein product [Caenorhabditis auriculariae]
MRERLIDEAEKEKEEKEDDSRLRYGNPTDHVIWPRVTVIIDPNDRRENVGANKFYSFLQRQNEQSNVWPGSSLSLRGSVLLAACQGYGRSLSTKRWRVANASEKEGRSQKERKRKAHGSNEHIVVQPDQSSLSISLRPKMVAAAAKSPAKKSKIAKKPKAPKVKKATTKPVKKASPKKKAAPKKVAAKKSPAKKAAPKKAAAKK